MSQPGVPDGGRGTPLGMVRARNLRAGDRFVRNGRVLTVRGRLVIGRWPFLHMVVIPVDDHTDVVVPITASVPRL